MAVILNVLRASDLLNVQFELINLTIDETGPKRLLKRESPGPAFIVVRLPPQHVAEHASVIGNIVARALSPPYPARLSGPTRFAFRLPEERLEVPLRLEDILGLVETLSLELPTDPLSPDAATVIEFPDRVLLVPETHVRLHHRSEPPKLDTIWTELWQTTLHDENGQSRFKAVMNPMDQVERLSESSLQLQDRKDIVIRSETEPTGPYVLLADQFVLSALGASVKLRSIWTGASASTTLSAWNHEAVLGRDLNVRTVREGFLYPFGLRVSIATITQRVFNFIGVPIAELKQHEEVSLREQEKTYTSRDLPFRRVQFNGVPRATARGAHNVYEVDATVSDAANNSLNCVLQTLFVPFEEARNADTLEQINTNEYVNRLDVLDLGYERIVLADAPDDRGGTDFNVASLTFGVKIQQPGDVGAVDPLFMPVMKSAKVSIPAIEQLRGVVGGTPHRAARMPIPIKFTQNYLDHGLNNSDQKQVFAEIIEPIEGLQIPTEKAGGLASPKFPKMDGLSRLMGPVSGVQNFSGQDIPPVNPEELIGQTKLLGMIFLKDIVDLSSTSDLGFMTERPKDLYNKVDNVDFVLRRPVITTVRTGGAIECRFVWKPKINDSLFGLLTQRDPPSGEPDPMRPPGRMQLIIKGRLNLAPEADKADLLIEGRLTNFTLSVAGLVNVEFNQILFLSHAGRKMEVKTSIAKIAFQGALAFAEEIRKAIPIGGFGDAAITPQSDGIIVSYGLTLPSVALGVLSLQNIAFNSSVSLPFVEKPLGIRFALSERSNPFIVAVAPFGGTGFFALEIHTSGPNAIFVEAAIEFGGILSFNLLGIVKGGVYVLAGVYIAIGGAAAPQISAHLRIGGYVDVLGLVTVSIELYLALEFADNRLAGTARLTIGVKVLFFSKSFSFEVHKEIAHLGAIPHNRRLVDFRSLVDHSQWESYCRAYA